MESNKIMEQAFKSITILEEENRRLEEENRRLRKEKKEHQSNSDMYKENCVDWKKEADENKLMLQALIRLMGKPLKTELEKYA